MIINKYLTATAYMEQNWNNEEVEKEEGGGGGRRRGSEEVAMEEKRLGSMATMKLGSKSEVFHREGETWKCTNGLPSDIMIKIGDASFDLHKFPLLSRSATLEKLIGELSSTVNGEQGGGGGEEEEGGEGSTTTFTLDLHDLPGGANSFELIAKFCYGVRLELNADNIVGVRCAAEKLQMTEEYGEKNLISLAENFLRELLGSWKDSLQVLRTCESEEVLLHAEKLEIVTRFLCSVANKAYSSTVETTNPKISSRPKNSREDWWYEDVSSSLSLSLFKRFIIEVGIKSMKPEFIAGSIVFYAKSHLRGISSSPSTAVQASETDQRVLLEEIVSMLPTKKGVTTTKLLLTLLRTAIVLQAGKPCKDSLEKMIGAQLAEAALEDVLIPNSGEPADTLYDVECVQRILDNFMLVEQADAGGSSEIVPEEQVEELMDLSPPTSSSISMVARLMDGYLAEVAPDANLKFDTFQGLAATIPGHGRGSDDGLYRAIDIYLKAHPWLTDSDREQLCRLLNCQKLSLDACTHAAQNERLPMRMIVQVLFFEQLRLRTSIASWFFVSDNLNTSKPEINNSSKSTNNQQLIRSDFSKEPTVDEMKLKLAELERECSNMKFKIEKFDQKSNSRNSSSSSSSSSWSLLPKRLSGMRPFCYSEEGAVDCQNRGNGNNSTANGNVKNKKLQQLPYFGN